MKRQVSRIRIAVLVALLLAPLLVLLVFFAAVDRLNPVTSYIYRIGTIASQYAGGPKAGNYTFVARLQSDRQVDVTQREGEPRLAIGATVCVRVAVRKRTEWKATELVPLEECAQNP